ncbi:MAG: hypothetical protein KBC30_04825 [Planctomycetes bacterium]|jgi:hypothetical protein|nr:hypothetical protein [Planctomycetota bacterium]
MQKLFIFLVIAMVFTVGCAREIHETHEYNKVVPNVQPVEPRSNVRVAPAPVTPTVPNYVEPTVPSYVEPTVPSYVEPTMPSYVEPTPVMPTPPAVTVPSTPDWINNSITATGTCAVDITQRPAQAKQMARRGAKLDAMRNLLEQVLGLRIDSQTEVRDMVAESDRINAETSGLIKGFQVVNESFEGDICTVTIAMPLRPVYGYVQK